MKHTPWHISFRNEQMGIENSKDKLITIINQNSDEKFKRGKLIAAAPDLLEACKEIFSLLEKELPVWYLRKHYNILTEAIQKAE